MKRLVLTLVLSVVTLLVASGTVVAKGNGLTPAKLEAQGWTCFPPPPDVMTHCVHPNMDLDALLAGRLASVPSRNFLGTRFIGTEILKRADLGSDSRPCRQGTEPDGTYEPVDFSGDGVPEYFSCHHNNELP